MPYQGTDRQAELMTLQDELAFTQKRLHKTNSKSIKAALSRQISQIRNDILHYGGKVRAIL